MSTYSVFEARNNLSRLIGESRAGTEVIIANRGKPVAKVVPIQDDTDSASGRAVAEWLQLHPLPGRLQRTADQLDEQITEAREAWQ